MPKRSSDDLFKLIKSLTPSEKGYFKKFATRHTIGEKNYYLKLFDLIDKQEEYDEKAILRKAKYIKQLPYLKNYLYELILKSLNLFEGDNVEQLQLGNQLNYVKILYDRGLYEECRKKLSKLKELTYNNEDFLEVLKVIGWERTLLKLNLYSGERGLMNTIFKEDQSVIQKIDNISHYIMLGNLLMEEYTKAGLVRTQREIDAAKSIIKHPLFKSEDRALSVTALGAYYQTYYLYHTFTNEPVKINYFGEKYLKLIESNLPILLKNIDIYLIALNNLALSQLHLKRFRDAFQTIEKLKNSAKKFPQRMSKTVEVKIFSYSSRLECNLYYNMGAFDKGMRIKNDLIKGLERNKGKINSATELTLYYFITCFYFGTGQYKKVFFWGNEIISHPDRTVREDIQLYTRIINLISIYELKDEILLRSVLKSVYKFFLKKQRLYKIEAIFLEYLKKSTRLKNKASEIETLKKLKNELLHASKDPLEKNALDYFDFIPWIESKINNKPFVEIIQEKAKKEAGKQYW